MKTGLIQVGKLLINEEIEIEANDRKRDHFQRTITKGSNIDTNIGWEIKREYKTKVLIHRKKNVGTLLEDKVWNLFHNLNFEILSSRNFTIITKLRGSVKKKKQLDLLAVDNEFAFILECKSREILGKKDLSKELAKYISEKSDVESTIKKILENRKLNFTHIFATENIEWNPNDRKDAKDAGIQIWDEYDIDALIELTKIASEGAKYQIYNQIFQNKKIKGFNITIPAIEGRMGGKQFYTFVLHPEDLLKIAYVHRRQRNSSFLDVSNSYQRIIKKSRIRSIEKFIESGGFFPGSIVINFHKKLRKDLIGSDRIKDKYERTVKPVLLTLPPYYGSAWVIDGQHRLYGYAGTEQRKKEVIPVIAFDGLPQPEESTMFVDINQNQKNLEAKILWDLYEDLYYQSDVESEQRLYALSCIGKSLHFDKDSPFFGFIEIPKENNSGDLLSLNTICGSLKSLGLVSRKTGLLFRNTYEESIPFTVKRLIIYFDYFRSHLTTEWNLGKGHFLRTNTGFIVLASILKDLLNQTLGLPEITNITKFKTSIEKFLFPLVNHIEKLSQGTIDRFRGAGGARQATQQVRYELSKVIKNANIGFRSDWVDNFERAREERLEERDPDTFVKEKLAEDEDEVLEFKGTFKLDINRMLLGDNKIRPNDEVKDESLKAIVGFLNKNGGTLIIGVLERHRFKKFEEELLASPRNNKYIIIGLDFDYKIIKDNWDGLQREIQQNIVQRIGGEVLDTDLVKIKKVKYEDVDLCVVKVKRSDTKQYLNNKFYIRRGNETVPLFGRDIDVAWNARGQKN